MNPTRNFSWFIYIFQFDNQKKPKKLQGLINQDAKSVERRQSHITGSSVTQKVVGVGEGVRRGVGGVEWGRSQSRMKMLNRIRRPDTTTKG